MKTILSIVREHPIIFLLCMVATALMSPLSSNFLVPDVGDFMNHLSAIVEAKAALAEGQFPLRVMPLIHDGWRYPFYQFYSPSTNMLAEFFYHWITPANPFAALKVTVWCALMFGGIYMYRLAYTLVQSRQAAALASVAYISSPYYIILFTHTGSFTEAVALGMLPAVLFYTLNLYYFSSTLKTFLFCALTWYLLATMHLITFFYSSLFVGFLLFWMTLTKYKSWIHLFRVGFAYALGWMMASWFLAPVGLYEKYLLVERYFGYDVHIKYRDSISNLLSPIASISTFKSYGSDGMIDLIERIHPNIGFPLLFGAGICLYALLQKGKIKNRADDWAAPLLILFFITFIVIWSPFNLWTALPRVFMMGQYSWRLMGQLIWIAALLFAWSAVWLFRDNLTNKKMLLGMLLLLFASSPWLQINEITFYYMGKDKVNDTDSMLVNKRTYLTDPATLQDSSVTVDNRVISMQSVTDKLKVNKLYFLSKSAFAGTVAPILLIEGSDAATATNADIELDGKIVAHVLVKPGRLHWTIPMAKYKDSTATPKFSLMIKTSDAATVNLESIAVGGFLDPQKVIDVHQTENFCQQNKAVTECQIPAAATQKDIELPILYYPDLMRVTLNGKRVAYHSVLYDDMLITAVRSVPGTVNKIKIYFNGLTWANNLSMAAWILWILLFVANMRKPSRVG
jgi:hypothetical protein